MKQTKIYENILSFVNNSKIELLFLNFQPSACNKFWKNFSKFFFFIHLAFTGFFIYTLITASHCCSNPKISVQTKKCIKRNIDCTYSHFFGYGSHRPRCTLEILGQQVYLSGILADKECIFPLVFLMSLMIFFTSKLVVGLKNMELGNLGGR